MLVATRIRLLSSPLLAVLVVFGGLLSGCQSSRPSFSFQPAPQRATQAMTPMPVVAAASDCVDAAVIPVPAAHVSPAAVRVQAKARRQAVAVRIATVAKVVLAPKAGHSRLLQRPHATAESGLGTTVLGVLGLIALPVAALGLILSGGGLGWIIVGGLAVLAVLVAYIDPFGR